MSINTTQVTPAWRLQGEEVAACNCAWGCPCQFNALPTQGHCEAMTAWHIDNGHFGDTRLDAVRFAIIVWWPGAIHEGNGTIQPILDGKTSEEQRAALIRLMSATCGGTFFEVFSAVCPNQREPVVAPIEMESDRERRIARVRIPGLMYVEVQPIRNPVTGEEFRGRIDLPNGFEYKQAEVANAVHWSTTAQAPLSMEHLETHSHLTRIDWSNIA